ncbi:tRNA (adenosine(37)-N6)-dimethylallyltransferase MiaA [Niveispirillum sp. SYP-B3756]|uniref:tRNA (adenosine(37)-N6)-dimethylallyltransferase MiaA n=1 Tax=Niveispirillum sp. SYP-B3756 TaxID=2662178 RepID=UPI00135F0516|nr:tRNA (adenosine(37)-N6)-dimethylallyltransferase MiaA [Niveispirillum sp. SYP-B3756]
MTVADSSFPQGDTKPVLVIGGPTASGKSGLALALARHANGVVINADSMQVYRELHLITARPSAADEAAAPHRLYGIVPAAERMSAARWRELALAEIDQAHGDGRLPIVVGGTGLYLRALMQGLSDIPDTPPEIRTAAMELQADIGSPALHARLAVVDPATAARLHPTDSQRLIRAWEVWQATGRSISDWQAAPPEAAPNHLHFRPLVVEPPRDRLYAQCDARFVTMLQQGALAEAEALDRLGLDPTLPAMKALGVPELRAVLHGQMDLPTATARAQQMTRNYAKRQLTWFRNQMGAAPRVDPLNISQESAFKKFYDRFMSGMT